jgi:hypothetical protein
MKKIFFFFILYSSSIAIYSQSVTIQVDALAGRKLISPYIYGRNNSLSDDQGSPLSAAKWLLYRDAGLRMLRENGGNNATKYNWRLKISSHPDWYNNVYAHNWDYAALSLQNNMSGIACMWAFQLIGKTASNVNNNFNDWAYNQSQWWDGVYQNLAGGGVVNTSGGPNATQNGNVNLYLMNWTADSTTGILDHWFGTKGLGLNKNTFRYWNMDNEPEIWSGTHDDVMPAQLSAEDFMQRYFEIAKKARAKYPEIKLLGPVPCNEWQWFTWNNNLVSSDGKYYTWLEFFIKRIAEEQAASGIKLLDVLDIHFYPGETNAADILQLHHVFFDKNYSYPGANGLKMINGGWDNAITKEYILERCNEWLVKYLGANHGISFSVSEMDIQSSDASVVSNWYASMLGTFADNGVEIFTPWSWKTGMWETLHLFSRYGKQIHVQSASNLDTYVSAYSSISSDLDSLTIFLVNRSQSSTYSTSINLSNFSTNNGTYNTLTLSNLSSNETFLSHTQNALVNGTITLSGNSFSVSLPPLSIKAILLAGNTPSKVTEIKNDETDFTIYYLNSGTIHVNYNLNTTGKVIIEIFDLQGVKIRYLDYGIKPAGNYSCEFDTSNFPKGLYFVNLKLGKKSKIKKIIIL